MEVLDFRQGAEAVLQLAIQANGYLNEQAPWSLMKRDGTRDQVADDLYAVLEAARIVALLLGPLLPDLSARMLQQLGQPPLQSSAAPAGDPQPTHNWVEQLRWGSLVPATPLPEPAPVMARLELAEAL
jgi:methionyl-tRNA synthetase